MKISTKGQYAIEALIYLAKKKQGEVVNIVEVAHGISVTPRYMEQIFFKLRKADLLYTVRGVKGGYKLAKAPENISMKEIIEATEGQIVPVPCVYDRAQCKSTIQGQCATRNMWKEMLSCVNRRLETTKLDELVKKYQELGDS